MSYRRLWSSATVPSITQQHPKAVALIGCTQPIVECQPLDRGQKSHYNQILLPTIIVNW